MPLPLNLKEFKEKQPKKEALDAEISKFTNLSNIVDPNEVCLVIRAMVASSYNLDTIVLCPSQKGQIGIMREAIANASYIGLRDFNELKRLPDDLPGDSFNVVLFEAGSEKARGVAKIDYQLNNLQIDNEAKETVLDFPKIDPKDDQHKCSIQWKGLELNEVDTNCCFKFMVKQLEQTLCETSNWCIFKARKLLKAAKNGCELSGGSGDDGAVILPNIDPIVVDFAKNTGNFGQGIWIPSQADKEGDKTAEESGDKEITPNGVLPKGALTADQLKSARNIQVNDPWLEAEPDAGLWKGTVY